MCRFFGVSRSGYYGYVKRQGHPEKDANLAEKLKQQQAHCFQTYGYRRMHLWLESQGMRRNSKTERLLNRQFQADKPNIKWVTNISYIHTKEGALYCP